MRGAIVAVVTLLAMVPAFAFAGGETTFGLPQGMIVIPANSPVTHATKDDDYHVRFDGRIAIPGTFRFHFAANQASVDFVPDASVAARLPHMRGERRVREILFDDEPSADIIAAAVLPAATIAAVKAHLTMQAEVHVVLTADSYVAGISECLGTGYSVVRFVSAQRTSVPSLSPIPAPIPDSNC